MTCVLGFPQPPKVSFLNEKPELLNCIIIWSCKVVTGFLNTPVKAVVTSVMFGCSHARASYFSLPSPPFSSFPLAQVNSQIFVTIIIQRIFVKKLLHIMHQIISKLVGGVE